MKRNQPRYPRTARLNELLREIVAEELERIGDDRLELVAVTSVVVEPDLRRAVVYFDTLAGADADDDVLEALRRAPGPAAGGHRPAGAAEAHAGARLPARRRRARRRARRGHPP